MDNETQFPIRFPESTIFEFYCNKNMSGSAKWNWHMPYSGSNKNEISVLQQFEEYYDEINYDEVNQIYVIEKDGKLNFVDAANPELTPVIYDFCHLYPGFATVRKGNLAGNLFFHEGLSEPASYRTVDVFEVKHDNLFGVETAAGDTLLDCVYRFVKVYPEFILAESDGWYSLFHSDGQKMFDGDRFDEINLTEMSRGFLYVRKNDKWGVAATSGYWIVPALFRIKEDIKFWGFGFFCCYLNGKPGLYDRQGKLVIPHEYDEIEHCTYCSPFPLIVKKNDKEGLLDYNGNVVFPCIYDKITFIEDCFRTWKVGKEELWYISHIRSFPESQPDRKLKTTCQLIESSSCDFFKIPWFLEMAGYEYTSGWRADGKRKTYEVNEKEAVRWYLMSAVVGKHYLWDIGGLSRTYNNLPGKQKTKILDLLKYTEVLHEKDEIKM